MRAPHWKKEVGDHCDRSNSPHKVSNAGKHANPPSSWANSCPTGPTKEMGKLRLSGFSKVISLKSLAHEPSSCNS